MTKRWMARLLVLAVLAVPVGARAHEGHLHKALGTISLIHDNHVEIKTTDGKTLTVTLDAKTAVTRGKDKLDATALKTGERVSVEYTEVKKVNVAQALKLATTAVRK